LGDLYDPEQHWTSRLRCRSGYKPFTDCSSFASFTLKGPGIATEMAKLVTSFGRLASNGITVLQDCSTVYHLDVVVNGGRKASPFVLNTSQVERVSIKLQR